MPILPPSLDDRSFDDLVAELLARIPGHTPEYTNPAEGDPGRTLIELFAWLGDTLLYRVNLIPERQRLAFLALLGMPLRPALPATGLVTVRAKDPTTSTRVSLLAGAALRGPVPFETLRPLQVQPVIGRAYIKRELTKAEETRVADLLPGLAELYKLGGQKAVAYTSEAVFGAAVPAGLDLVKASVDHALWIALLAPPKANPSAVRDSLAGKDNPYPSVLHVGLCPALTPPAQDTLEVDLAEPPPLPVVWEVPEPSDDATAKPRYKELLVVADRTAGLTRAGVVELALPVGLGLPSNDVLTNVDAGVGEGPPRIDEPEIAARLVTWVRLRPAVRMDRLSLSWVGVNAVEIDQRQTWTAQLVGRGDGSADQQMRLPATSVDPDSLRMQVDEEGRGWVDWTRVEDLAAAGRDDSAYALDAEAGTVRFGDGIRGRLVPEGRRVRVASMRAGGGTAGNLGPGLLKTIAAKDVEGRDVVGLEVEQTLPTLGGAAAETLDLAERRIPGFLRHRDRAVTAADLRALAAETPGANVARVEVLRGFKPHQRRSGVPGVVSVMVLPEKDEQVTPNPLPGQPTIRAVHAWLADRVPLATELYVIGCEYVPVGLSVGVQIRPGFARDETLLAVRRALASFLWPLPPGGPLETLTGWPLGRPVRDREIEVVVARVPGVDEVLGVRVFQGDAAGRSWKAVPVSSRDGAAQIALSAWQLPELRSVVLVTDMAPPAQLTGAPDPFGDDPPRVAIPVVPEVC